jgi:hypothetical protein
MPIRGVAVAMVDRPRTAVILLIAGGAFYIVGGFAAAMLVGAIGAFVGGLGAKGAAAQAQQTATIAIATGLLSGVTIIISAILANTGSKTKVRIGAILAIVFSLIGIINTLGGLLIGLVLVIVGSVLALIWKPEEVRTQSAQATTPTSQQ